MAKEDPLEKKDKREKVEIEDILGNEDLDLDDAVSEEKEPTPPVVEKTSEKVFDTADEATPSDQGKVPEKEPQKPEEKESSKKTGKKKKDKKPFKIIGLAVVLVLAVTAAVLGSLYYLDQREEADEEPTEETVVQEDPEEEPVDENYVYISSEVGLNMRQEPNTNSVVIKTIPYATRVPVLSEDVGWIETEYQDERGWVSSDYTTRENPLAYENSTYGFRFEFTPSWVGYRFFETSTPEETVTVGYYVALPTTDTSWVDSGEATAGYASLFAMAIYTPEEWTKIEKTEGPKPAKLGESKKYVYTYLPGQNYPNDLAAQYDEIDEIVKTFEVIK